MMKSECKKLRKNGWRLVLEGIPDATGFAELCCIDPKESNPLFAAVNCSKSTKVFRFEWQGKAYYYKEYLFRNPWKHRKILQRGKHLMHIADLLHDAGFETPCLVCHGRSGMRVFVVSEDADAPDSVYDVLMDKSATGAPDIQRFRYLFGQEIGRLHAAGFVHGDLRWGNILVKEAASEQPVFIFIDNDRTRKYRKIPASRRLRNLVQIKYPGSLLDKPESDWDRMWEGYVAGNPEVRKNRAAWRRRVDARNSKRVAAWWKKPRNRHLLEQRPVGEGQNQ